MTDLGKIIGECLTCETSCECKKSTKESLIEAIEDHVNTSKEIRKAALEYIKTLPIDVDMDILEKFIMTCKFDEFNEFIRKMPEFKAVKDLKRGEFFVNPDGGEKLQAWSIKLNDDGSCTLNALHYDNELTKYLFDQERMVIIPEK